MPNNKNKKAQDRVVRTAQTIKDGADTVFDSVHNAVDATEDAAMKTVDKTSHFIKKQLDD